jgi:hypothetical protein
MNRTSWMVGFLCVALLAACNGNRRDNTAGTTGSGNESGSMQSGGATDTARTMGDTTAPVGATRSDTARTRGADSASTSQR